MAKIGPCLGVPVEYDENAVSITLTLDWSRPWWPWRMSAYPCFCEQRGIWRWSKIVAGRALLGFPPREQQAILLHEVGHVKLGHVGERLRSAWKILLWPSAFAALCRRQELQADSFAAHCGYGMELAQALSRVQDVQSPLHPRRADRLAFLYAIAASHSV